MSARRPYVRSMDGWWKRDAYFIRSMAREVTAVFVALYAIVLLIGVVRLSQGEAAFDGFLKYLQNWWMPVFHLIVLAVFCYHTWSWFYIMPKTMPIMFVGGKRVQPGTITGTGLAASVIACLAVLFIVGGMS